MSGDLEPGDKVIAAGQQGTLIEVRKMRSLDGNEVIGMVVEVYDGSRVVYSPQEVRHQP